MPFRPTADLIKKLRELRWISSEEKLPPIDGRQLASLPPHLWAETLQRASLVDEYLQIVNPTARDAELFAKRLNLSSRTFYRLVGAFQAARNGYYAAQSNQGVQSPLDPRTDAVVAEVRRELGVGAKDSQVLAETRARCDRLGIPAPSLSAVRTRTGRPIAHANLTARFPFDLILDACPLALDVKANDDSALPAVLTALIHVPTGSILGHALGCGQSSATDVLAVLRDALPRGRGSGVSTHKKPLLTLGTSSGIGDLDPRLRAAMLAIGIKYDPWAKAERVSAALIATIGRKLGRIPFAPMRRSPSSDDGLAVPLKEAREAVAKLVQDRQDADRANVATLTQLLGPRRASALRFSVLEVLKAEAQVAVKNRGEELRKKRS